MIGAGILFGFALVCGAAIALELAATTTTHKRGATMKHRR